MYLHINKNCVIKNNSVLGIFSVQNININDLYENIKNITDLSEGNPKTIILIEEMGENKGYISKLSVDTIKKRSMFF